MAWWLPLAAAAIPSVINIGADLLGLGPEETTIEDAGGSDPGKQSRMALHQMLVQRAQQSPFEQSETRASIAQLNDLIGNRRRSDRAALVRRGAGGSEMAIAQAAGRSDAFADALLGITKQAAGRKRQSLQDALGSANSISNAWWKRTRAQQLAEQKRQSGMMGSLSALAQSAGQAYASRGSGG